MNENKEKEVRERFDKEIKPILENPLYEYNHTEGHEKPKKCTEEDLDKVFAFLLSELQRRENETIRRDAEIARGLAKPPIDYTKNPYSEWPDSFTGYNSACSDISSTLLAQVKE